MGSFFSKKNIQEIKVKENCFEGVVTLVKVDDTDSNVDDTYKLY